MTTPVEPATPPSTTGAGRRLLAFVGVIWIASFTIAWAGVIAVAGWALGGLLGWWPAATVASIMGLVAVAVAKSRNPPPDPSASAD
jgi:hypothetical protein